MHELVSSFNPTEFNQRLLKEGWRLLRGELGVGGLPKEIEQVNTEGMEVRLLYRWQDEGHEESDLYVDDHGTVIIFDPQRIEIVIKDIPEAITGKGAVKWQLFKNTQALVNAGYTWVWDFPRDDEKLDTRTLAFRRK